MAYQVPVLEPTKSRFVPQQDEQVIGLGHSDAINRDYDHPPKPLWTPDRLHTECCHACQTSWLYNPQCGTGHPLHNGEYDHLNDLSLRSMIVHIHGACPENGHSPTRSSVGVYFGPSSSYNTSMLRPDFSNHIVPSNHTSLRANIAAAICALDIVRQHVVPARRTMIGVDGNGHQVDIPQGLETFRLIVATDSTYLVDGLCKWRQGWKLDDQGERYWKKKKGEVILNGDLFAQAVKAIVLLSNVGVQVQWYLVPLECNDHADVLARAAFGLAEPIKTRF